MRLIPAMLGLLLCAAPALAQDCKLTQAASLPITTDGAIGVPVTLDGKPETLALSLESEFNEMFHSYAADRGFRMGRSHFVTGANQAPLALAYVKEFQLGPIKGPNVEFLVWPGEQPASIGVGSLSQTALRDFDFEIDFQARKLNLFLQDHCPGKVVYWTATGVARLPFVSTDMDGRFQMALDDKPLRVLLTPGNDTSLIGSMTMHRLFNVDLDSPGVEKVPGTSFYRYTFKTLAVDSLTIRNPKILIYEQTQPVCDDKPRYGLGSRIDHDNGTQAHCFGGYDMTLGSTVLKQLRLFFANKEHALYLTPASAH